MEEEFRKLYLDYLNEEEIELKKLYDEIEQEERLSSSKSDSPFTIDDAITIDEYVNNFLGIKSDCSDLYHSGLKSIGSEYVFGVDNNFANKNPELVYSGYILLVIDARGNRGSYINPFYLKKAVETKDSNEEFKLFLKQKVNDLKKLEAFYKKYITLKNMCENNKQFYDLLKKTKKLRKFKSLEKKKKGDL